MSLASSTHLVSVAGTLATSLLVSHLTSTCVVDSGASQHMKGTQSLLSFLDLYILHPSVTLADGSVRRV